MIRSVGLLVWPVLGEGPSPVLGFAHEVIRDHVHEKLARHHVRRLAAQRVHAQARLDVIKAKLHLPAALIPRGDLQGVMCGGIAQRGDDLEFLRAMARDAALHLHQTQRECGRQCGVRGGMLAFGALRRAGPGDVPVVGTDASPLSVCGSRAWCRRMTTSTPRRWHAVMKA